MLLLEKNDYPFPYKGVCQWMRLKESKLFIKGVVLVGCLFFRAPKATAQSTRVSQRAVFLDGRSRKEATYLGIALAIGLVCTYGMDRGCLRENKKQINAHIRQITFFVLHYLLHLVLVVFAVASLKRPNRAILYLALLAFLKRLTLHVELWMIGFPIEWFNWLSYAPLINFCRLHGNYYEDPGEMNKTDLKEIQKIIHSIRKIRARFNTGDFTRLKEKIEHDKVKILGAINQIGNWGEPRKPQGGAENIERERAIYARAYEDIKQIGGMLGHLTPWDGWLINFFAEKILIYQLLADYWAAAHFLKQARLPLAIWLLIKDLKEEVLLDGSFFKTKMPWGHALIYACGDLFLSTVIMVVGIHFFRPIKQVGYWFCAINLLILGGAIFLYGAYQSIYFNKALYENKAIHVKITAQDYTRVSLAEKRMHARSILIWQTAVLLAALLLFKVFQERQQFFSTALNKLIVGVEKKEQAVEQMLSHL